MMLLLISIQLHIIVKKNIDHVAGGVLGLRSYSVRCTLRRTFYVRREMGVIQGTWTEKTEAEK
jgi:hypothetical protein